MTITLNTRVYKKKLGKKKEENKNYTTMSLSKLHEVANSQKTKVRDEVPATPFSSEVPRG